MCRLILIRNKNYDIFYKISILFEKFAEPKYKEEIKIPLLLLSTHTLLCKLLWLVAFPCILVEMYVPSWFFLRGLLSRVFRVNSGKAKTKTRITTHAFFIASYYCAWIHRRIIIYVYGGSKEYLECVQRKIKIQFPIIWLSEFKSDVYGCFFFI